MRGPGAAGAAAEAGEIDRGLPNERIEVPEGQLSTMIPPPPFDAESYAADPQPYLKRVEAGRVWQTLPPGAGVPRLTRLSPPAVRVLRGEPVELRVRTAAGMPVTFTSFDLGRFRNRLSSVTVAADEEGLANAVFTGTPGGAAGGQDPRRVPGGERATPVHGHRGPPPPQRLGGSPGSGRHGGRRLTARSPRAGRSTAMHGGPPRPASKRHTI